MEEKKYELVKEDYIEWEGHTLYRIKALKDFCLIRRGNLGGYIECEQNLSQHVYCNAKVYDHAKIYNDADEGDHAEIYGEARVYNNAQSIWQCKNM